MENTKVIKIEAKDYYGDKCLVDQVNTNKAHSRKPEGEVHVFEISDDGQKKLLHKSNLVVYLGREMLAQRLVNLDNGLVSPTKDEFICWFGVGDGGVRPADPLDPVPPINSDDALYSNVMISDSTATYGDYHTFAESGYPQTGYYKKQFDDVNFEQDTLNDSRYLVLKIEITIGVNDANGNQLSEAGLFSAESTTPGYSGNFHLFARVIFPSLIKSVERRLLFVWYLYV